MSTVNNNAEWSQIRLRLTEFPPNYYPDKTIKFLDACRASKKLRQLFPYINLGRLGLWRYDPNESKVADFFICLYFDENKYVVSHYDDLKRVLFDEVKTAISFVEQNLHNEKIFD